MSLLMEALKKAEAEKKKAALEQQSLKVTRTGEHAAVPGAGVTPGEAPVPPFTGTFDTSKLSLEPIERTPTAEPLPPPAPPGEEEADRYALAPREHEEFPPGRAREIDLAAEEPYEYGEPISLTEPSPPPWRALRRHRRRRRLRQRRPPPAKPPSPRQRPRVSAPGAWSCRRRGAPP